MVENLDLPKLPPGYRWKIKASVGGFDRIYIQKKGAFFWYGVAWSVCDRKVSDYRNEVESAAKYVVKYKFRFIQNSSPREYRGIYYT